MKDRPLAVQIWIVLGAIFVLAYLLIVIFTPLSMRVFINTEMFAMIEDTQEFMLEHNISNVLIDEKSFDDDGLNSRLRAVKHVFLPEAHLRTEQHHTGFLRLIQADALAQIATTQRYTRVIEPKLMFYVIRKETINGQKGYLVSYVWGRFQTRMLKVISQRLFVLLAGVLSISWIISIILARYLTKPLVKLKSHVQRIADRDWLNPIDLQRRDEIGELGESIERMRTTLISQDEMQQTFLQQVSHELKTPIMVIRSYAHSISDGIFPKGDLASTVKVIEEETERLEKCVHSLLSLTKLDYLMTHKLDIEEFDMAALLQESVERLSWRRTELTVQVDVFSCKLKGDPKKWLVALENLLDNQLRYAEHEIRVQASQVMERKQSYLLIRIWNDGPQIEPETLKNLFDKFKKGRKGEFGLGLAIVKCIADLHKALVWVENEPVGVAFYLQIPLER